MQAPGALLVAMLAARARDQRAWIVVIPGLTAAAFVVLAFGAEVPADSRRLRAGLRDRRAASGWA
ncbi:MAG: hypothetical protein PGN33_15215 [Methylobacterium radiotolerans]